MAIAETTLVSGMVSFTNLALAGSIASYTSQSSAAYAVSNILQQHRSKRWRSSDVTVQQQIVIDLGSAQTFNTVALIDSNADTAQTITIEHSTTSGIASPDSVNLTTYAQSPVNRVMRWYLTGVGTKQFVRLTLPANWSATDLFHQLGVLWIGTATDVTVVPGAKIDLQDPSDRTQSYAGATFVDTLQPFHTVDFDADTTSFTQALALKNLSGGLGSKHALLDLLASTSTAAIKAEVAFYGLLAARRGLSTVLRSPTDNSVQFQFEEARG